MQTRVRGATWPSGGWQLEGPWVSGPWLGIWGGNAKALPRSKFYTRESPCFLSCGTMFPRKFTFAGDVALRRASDPVTRR